MSETNPAPTRIAAGDGHEVGPGDTVWVLVGDEPWGVRALRVERTDWAGATLSDGEDYARREVYSSEASAREMAALMTAKDGAALALSEAERAIFEKETEWFVRNRR
jgi:hypothetical protein